uniref:Uncharacterized protein n=1 Tax=Oryza glumipatula TaxID=40148 RepID=A0A0D9ZM22_9ORYZ
MAVAGAVAMSGGILLLLLLLLLAAACVEAGELPPISRRSFPKGFIFGTSSASYQVRLPFRIILPTRDQEQFDKTAALTEFLQEHRLEQTVLFKRKKEKSWNRLYTSNT